MAELGERFWSKVDKSGECWNWTAFKRGGYGRLWHRGACRSAHRVSYEAYKGPIPKGLSVLHQCDNRACVNPDHLSVGDNAQNNIERDERGRLSNKYRHLVSDVRAMYQKGWKQVQISRYFGMSPSTVHDIVHYNRWRRI